MATQHRNITAAAPDWAKEAEVVSVEWTGHEAHILNHLGEELALRAGDTFECVSEQAESFIAKGLAKVKPAAKAQPAPATPAPAPVPVAAS